MTADHPVILLPRLSSRGAAHHPAEPVTWAPVLVLSLLGVPGLTLGILGWQRREINGG